MDSEHLSLAGNHRAAAVAGIDQGVVLDHAIHRGPARVARGIGLGDDPRYQRELGLAQRVAGHKDGHADLDGALIEAQRWVALAGQVDDGQIGALAGAQDARVDGLGAPGNEHVQNARAGDYMVGGHRQA